MIRRTFAGCGEGHGQFKQENGQAFPEDLAVFCVPRLRKPAGLAAHSHQAGSWVDRPALNHLETRGQVAILVSRSPFDRVSEHRLGRLPFWDGKPYDRVRHHVSARLGKPLFH